MASEQPEPFHVPFDLRRWAQDAFGVEHALSPTQSAIGGAVLDSIWSLGIAEGLRQATEGWERQWSAEVAGVGAASDEWAQDEDEQAIRDWALDRPGSVVRSRLVGPWEPAEQPEPERTWRRDDACGREHTYRDGCAYAEQPEGSDR